MNVSLTPELNQFVTSKVSSGRYTSASEVVREALRLLEERDEDRSTRLQAFQQEMDERIQSLDRGEFVDAATSRAQLKALSDEWKKRKA